MVFNFAVMKFTRFAFCFTCNQGGILISQTYVMLLIYKVGQVQVFHSCF